MSNFKTENDGVIPNPYRHAEEVAKNGEKVTVSETLSLTPGKGPNSYTIGVTDKAGHTTLLSVPSADFKWNSDVSISGPGTHTDMYKGKPIVFSDSSSRDDQTLANKIRETVRHVGADGKLTSAEADQVGELVHNAMQAKAKDTTPKR